MNIVSEGDFNAMLLAFSVMLQRPSNNMNVVPTLPAELTWLMTSLSTDFADFVYPDKASPMPSWGLSDEVVNLLVKEVTQFDGTHSYVVAAITPLGKKLKVKVTGDAHLDTSLNNGWVVIEQQPYNGFTIESQRQNELVSMLVLLGGYYKDGSATIEYYEDSDTPTFTKQITWTGGWLSK